jgi:hypothetical protein
LFAVIALLTELIVPNENAKLDHPPEVLKIFNDLADVASLDVICVSITAAPLISVLAPGFPSGFVL